MSAAIQSSAGATTGTATTLAISTPSGVVSGDLLFCLLVWGSGQSGWNGVDWALAGFTQVAIRQHADSGFLGAAIGRRTADGTEGATITFQRSGGGSDDQVSGILLRIDGHTGTPDSTSTEGNSSSMDFASHSPGAGSNEYLWLACGAVDSGVAVSTDPTGYTEDANSPQIETGQTTAYLASKVATAASDDPSAVTLASSTRWIPFTAAVQSAAAGAGGFTSPLSLMGVG